MDRFNLVVQNGVKMNFNPTKLFHEQMGERVGIHKSYYDKMLVEAPGLLATNVNHWFKHDHETRVVRTLDGKARAFVSKSDRILDNFDMLQAVLPPLKEFDGGKGVEFHSCEITERRMYLKMLFPKIEGEVKKGDVVRAGLMVSNSEVGAGGFRVEPFTLRLVCTNGMVNEAVLNKYHVGRQHNLEEELVQEILTDETKAANDEALFRTVRDLVKYSLTDDAFKKNLARYQQAAGEKITGDPTRVVEVTRKTFGFTKDQGADIMRHLVEGGDLSRWGLANAVTATAHGVDNYDDATWMQRAGGRVIELPQKDWRVIAEAN